MKMLGGYEEAAITAARMAAAKSAKYVATPDADPLTMPNGERRPDGVFAQGVEPGQIEQVPYGYDLQPLDWQWPNTDHGDFVKAALRGIACGLGVSYNALANDLEGVNYSSLRQGALAERDLWMRLQTWWIEWVSEPLYRRWCAYAIRSGRVTRQNGVSLPLDQLDALTEASFQGRRWPWVDPLKDLQANELALKLRTKSVSAIIRESGHEPEDVWDELANDEQKLAALGIPLNLTTLAPAAAPKQEPKP
jgi:lambda family phage portal protein